MYKIKMSEDLYRWAKETRCLQEIDYDTYKQAEKDFVDAFGYELLNQPTFGGIIEKV